MIPKLSVIIPNYNHAEFLEQRIQSILDQTFTDFELIILDDNSTDNSEYIINAYKLKDKRIAYYPSDHNSGNTFKQWNKGVSLAKCDLVWIAESDDYCEPNFIEKTIKPLIIDKSIVISYSQSYQVDQFGVIKNSCLYWTNDLNKTLFLNNFTLSGISYIKQFLLYHNTIPNASAVIFRKFIYNRIEMAPEFLHGNGDYLTWLKMLCFGKIAFEASALNYFRRHEKSVIGILHTINDKSKYQEQFDFQLRKSFHQYLKTKKIAELRECMRTNHYFMALDKGNHGLFLLKKGKYIKGFWLILQATFYPVFQSGFIKRAVSN